MQESLDSYWIQKSNIPLQERLTNDEIVYFACCYLNLSGHLILNEWIGVLRNLHQTIPRCVVILSNRTKLKACSLNRKSVIQTKQYKMTLVATTLLGKAERVTSAMTE